MNYLEIIKNVLANGTQKQATRYDAAGNVIPVENGTIGTFCEIFRHDMSEGFPLTTLRKMPWRSIRVELEGFIKGVTDKKWYQERGCKFWDEWANPEVVNTEIIKEQSTLCNKYQYSLPDMPTMKKIVEQTTTKLNIQRIQKEQTDLGPIYGYQWRKFGQHYGEFKTETIGEPNAGGEYQYIDNSNGVPKGFDQLKSIVEKLKTSPYDRRMVCSAWNPNQAHMMALPPCHWGWNVVVYGNKLNLIWHQRSCDLLLGVGANIASYGLLLELLAREASLVPGELVGTLADCHIYENHLEAAHTLVSRSENKLPTLDIDYWPGDNHTRPNPSFSIFDWEWDQAHLTGYNPYDKIDVGAVTV